MKVSRFVIAISVVIIFVGIWVSNVLGFWETSGSKSPRQFESGEFTGLNDPGDIRDSYTFGNIEDSFNIDSALLAQAFGFESDNPSTIRLNELESLYEGLGFPVEIGTGPVKYFVALYTGLPLDEPEGLTIVAANILKDHEKITETLYINLMLSAVDLNGIYEITGTLDIEPEEHDSPTEVTGGTTIGQALKMGISFGDARTALNEHVKKE